MKDSSTLKEKKPKKVMVDGPIQPDFIGQSIAKHQSKLNIGAHDIFLGQVRADVISEKEVVGIDYSVHEEMAEEVFHEIRENAFSKWRELTCMHIYHSKGLVKAGEICLFVFVSAVHRQDAFEACRFIVEEIKTKVPVFGKEVFEDGTHNWKVNQ